MPAFNAALIGEQFERINQRLRAIEAQLAALSERAGVPYESPSDGVPPEVVELAQAGKPLDAIRRYRELTGAGPDEAREVVAGI